MYRHYGAGLHHPHIPPGPLPPFNERTRLKLLVSDELRRRRYSLSLERIERELERMALPNLDTSRTHDEVGS
jgi:hypothetical protein